MDRKRVPGVGVGQLGRVHERGSALCAAGGPELCAILIILTRIDSESSSSIIVISSSSSVGIVISTATVGPAAVA